MNHEALNIPHVIFGVHQFGYHRTPFNATNDTKESYYSVWKELPMLLKYV